MDAALLMFLHLQTRSLRAMLKCSVKPVLMEVHCFFCCGELGYASEYRDINAVSVSGWAHGSFVHDILQVDAYNRQISLEVPILPASCALSPQAWCQADWTGEGSLWWLAACTAHAVMRLWDAAGLVFNGFLGMPLTTGQGGAGAGTSDTDLGGQTGCVV